MLGVAATAAPAPRAHAVLNSPDFSVMFRDTNSGPGCGTDGNEIVPRQYVRVIVSGFDFTPRNGALVTIAGMNRQSPTHSVFGIFAPHIRCADTSGTTSHCNPKLGCLLTQGGFTVEATLHCSSVYQD